MIKENVESLVYEIFVSLITENQLVYKFFSGIVVILFVETEKGVIHNVPFNC